MFIDQYSVGTLFQALIRKDTYGILIKKEDRKTFIYWTGYCVVKYKEGTSSELPVLYEPK